jgi:hypothetical protein
LEDRIQNTGDSREYAVGSIQKTVDVILLNAVYCLLYSSFYIATFTGVGFKTFFKSSGDISARSPLLPALI